jgi:hypothetical protein
MHFPDAGPRNVRYFFQIAFLLLVAPQSTLWAQHFAQHPAEEAKPATLTSRLEELQAIEGYTHQPFEPWVRESITDVKHGMRDLIFAELKPGRSAMGNAGGIRAAILRRFQRAGLKQRKDGWSCGKCFLHGFDIKAQLAPGDHRDLLAVALVLEIPWGDDSSLYIFKRRGSGWEIVLAAEVNGYDNPEGSQSHFRYEVSPPTQDGAWFVVTGSVNNHEASAWHYVTFTAQAPGEEPLIPRVLVRNRQFLYLRNDIDHTRDYRFKAARDRFVVSFIHDIVDSQAIWATHGYRVSGGKAYAEPVVCHLGQLSGKEHPCPD